METWNYQFHSNKINLAVAYPKSNLPRLSAQRLALDRLLFNQMKQSPHAEVLTGSSINNIQQQDHGLRLQGDGICIDAELVIRATGEQITSKEDPSLFVFSRCYYEGVETKEEKGLEVYYFDQPLRGCLFICPLSGHRYNVEIGVERKAYIASGLSMDALQDSYLQNRPALKQRFATARSLGKRKGTSMRLRTKTRWVAQNMIQIGSGAFCVNPITGLGVGNAMSMGKLVAEQIRDLYAQKDFSQQLIVQYPKSAKKKYRNILLMNRAVNLIQRYFRFFEPVLALLLNRNFVKQLFLEKDLIKGILPWNFFRKLSNERSQARVADLKSSENFSDRYSRPH